MRETTSTPQGLLLLLHASIFLWKIWYVSSKTLRKLWGWQHLDPNACSSYFLSALSSFSSFSSSSSLFPPITRLHCSSSMTTSPPAPAVIPKRWQKRGNNYKKNDSDKDKNKRQWQWQWEWLLLQTMTMTIKMFSPWLEGGEGELQQGNHSSSEPPKHGIRLTKGYALHCGPDKDLQSIWFLQ